MIIIIKKRTNKTHKKKETRSNEYYTHIWLELKKRNNKKKKIVSDARDNLSYCL